MNANDAMKPCKWCSAEDINYCDCEERRSCPQAGTPGHIYCGALPCGCPRFIVECDGKCKPKPGSDEAVIFGCTCPVLDNAHGKGRFGDGENAGWWISGDCPMHAQKENSR